MLKLLKVKMIRRRTLLSNSYETCDPFRNKIESLHVTLSKFTKGRENTDMILSNPKALYKKVVLGYQPNKNA